MLRSLVLLQIVQVVASEQCSGDCPGTLRGFLASTLTRTSTPAPLAGVDGDPEQARWETIWENEAVSLRYAAMPKNKYGNLGHSAVHYVLHRHLARHGWSLNDARDYNASVTDLLRGHTSERIRKGLERKLKTQGLDLQDTLRLVGTIEKSIQGVIFKELRTYYDLHELPDAAKDVKLSSDVVDGVIDTYMMVVFLHKNISALLPGDVKRLAEEGENYPNFEHIQQQTRGARAKVDGRLALDGKFNFEDMKEVMLEIMREFRRRKDLACTDTREQLIDMEDRNQGCVRMHMFYDSYINQDDANFAESPEYLKDNGMLEDSDEKDVSLITANYMAAGSNCRRVSSLHSFCCVNECDDLSIQIEKELQAPWASPNQIADIVMPMRPDGQGGEEDLLRHLETIAQQHNGSVPVYGRLFAQWLHHAFPRECPFVQGAGVANDPAAPQDAFADVDSVIDYVAALKPPSETERLYTTDTCMPWEESESELLFVTSGDEDLEELAPWPGHRFILMVGIASFSLASLRMFGNSWHKTSVVQKSAMMEAP